MPAFLSSICGSLWSMGFNCDTPWAGFHCLSKSTEPFLLLKLFGVGLSAPLSVIVAWRTCKASLWQVCYLPAVWPFYHSCVLSIYSCVLSITQLCFILGYSIVLCQMAAPSSSAPELNWVPSGWSTIVSPQPHQALPTKDTVESCNCLWLSVLPEVRRDVTVVWLVKCFGTYCRDVQKDSWCYHRWCWLKVQCDEQKLWRNTENWR